MRNFFSLHYYAPPIVPHPKLSIGRVKSQKDLKLTICKYNHNLIFKTLTSVFVLSVKNPARVKILLSAVYDFVLQFANSLRQPV